ncbi:MAG: major facilitator superfamily 1 [Bacteroidetes bacterium]|nr:major facilitator superfamily 1 [Bacteroidota bacterium]
MNSISFKRKTSSATVPAWLVLLMAACAGITVANIYYCQPILKEIASEFNVSESSVGMIPMLSQIGYGLGLFFITPLGDKVDKRKLILGLQYLLIGALVLLYLSSTIVSVWVLSVLIGLFAVSVQVIMPMAAGFNHEERGKNVGIIFTGVLIGILAARVFSGTIADILGWRQVYLVSLIAVAIGTVFLTLFLPNGKPNFEGSYSQLLRSALFQFKRFKLLRRLAFIGILQFGLLSAFWTTLTFHLSGVPFNFSSGIIGLFGLVAVAGALVAPIMGKKADKGGVTKVRFVAVALVVVSILMMWFGQHSVMAMVVGVLLLDIGAQSIQVSNVAMMYTLDPSSHSRINTIYMSLFFTGGALGTLAGILCWQLGGWNWVMAQMFLSAVGIIWLLWKEKRG